MAKKKSYSKNYAKVKNYYDNGLWSKERVYNAVGRWITEAEYEEITGEPYIPEEIE